MRHHHLTITQWESSSASIGSPSQSSAWPAWSWACHWRRTSSGISGTDLDSWPWCLPLSQDILSCEIHTKYPNLRRDVTKSFPQPAAPDCRFITRYPAKPVTGKSLKFVDFQIVVQLISVLVCLWINQKMDDLETERNRYHGHLWSQGGDQRQWKRCAEVDTAPPAPQPPQHPCHLCATLPASSFWAEAASASLHVLRGPTDVHEDEPPPQQLLHCGGKVRFSSKSCLSLLVYSIYQILKGKCKNRTITSEIRLSLNGCRFYWTLNNVFLPNMSIITWLCFSSREPKSNKTVGMTCN